MPPRVQAPADRRGDVAPEPCPAVRDLYRLC